MRAFLIGALAALWATVAAAQGVGPVVVVPVHLPVVSQLAANPSGARAAAGVGPSLFNITDPIYGGPSDAAYRGAAHYIANGNTLNLGARYVISATVSCTAGNPNITVTPAAALSTLSGNATIQGLYWISVTGCGSSGGTFNSNNPRPNSSTGIIATNTNAGTTYSGAATITFFTNDAQQNALLNDSYYGSLTVTPATSTLVTGTQVFTTGQANGGQRIMIEGAGPGGGNYYGVILSQSTDGKTVVINPAPSTSISGSARIWWGPMLFDPDDGTANGGRYVEIPKAGSGTNNAGGVAASVSRISGVVDPFTVTLTSSVPTSMAAFGDGYLKKGSDYWPAFQNVVNAIGYARLRDMTKPDYIYFPTDAFMATASGDQSPAGYAILCGEGQVYWPEGFDFVHGTAACNNQRVPPFPDAKDIIPAVHLKRLTSLSSGSTAVIDFVGASQMVEGTNGAGYINGWEHEICSAFMRAYPDLTIKCNYRGIGGTTFGMIDPNGHVYTGSVAGVPNQTLPWWYSNTSQPWLTYVENDNPDVIITGWTNVDGAGLVYSAVKDFVAITQGSSWNSTTGKYPDLIFGIDGYQPLNYGGQWGGDYTASMLRSYAVAGRYTMGNGGRIGLLDASRMAHLVVDGYDPASMPLRRNQVNTASCSSLPCSWPTQTTDMTMSFFAVFNAATGNATLSAAVIQAWAAINNEMDFLLGGGGNGVSVVGGAATAYPGNLLRVFYNTSTTNLDYQVDTYSFTTAANCSGTSGQNVLNCSTAAANQGHQLGTVSVPNGASGGTTPLVATLSTVSADGKTLTLAAPLGATVTNVALSIYDTQIPRTATNIAAFGSEFTGSCYNNPTHFTQFMLQLEVRGTHMQFNYCNNGPGAGFEADVVRAQTPFYPTVTGGVTGSTGWVMEFATNFGSGPGQAPFTFALSGQMEAHPEFPPYLPTGREMVDIYGACISAAEPWNQYNLFGGQCDNHRGNLGATLIEQPILSSLRLR